jgi:hypothetical protein
MSDPTRIGARARCGRAHGRNVRVAEATRFRGAA